MDMDISENFKKNKKNEQYIAHNGIFNPKRRIPNTISQKA